MLLYHGTSESVAMVALQEGLRPRSDTGDAGRWEHTECPSNPAVVYLTDAYPLYFGHNAVKDVCKERVAILELDTDKMHESMFIPDEDFLEQCSRKEEVPKESFFKPLRDAGNDMKARTAFYRENAWRWSHMWESSLGAMGTCGYFGGIDPSAINRVAFIDMKKRLDLSMKAMDPCITPLNYMIMGEQYRAITRWVFTGDTEPCLFSMVMQGMMSRLEEQYSNRDGIEVVVL